MSVSRSATTAPAHSPASSGRSRERGHSYQRSAHSSMAEIAKNENAWLKMESYVA